MPRAKRPRDAAQNEDEPPASRRKGKPASSPALDSQTFTKEVTSLMQKAKPKKDNSYIASFKKKVDEQREEVTSAIKAQLTEYNEGLSKRKQAAEQLIACVKPNKPSPTSAQSNAPSYMFQAHQMGLELGELCKEVVATYNTVVHVVEEQAANLPSGDDWADDFRKAQEMLKAGAKHTFDSIETLMGADDALGADNFRAELELDNLTPEQIDAWNAMALSAEVEEGLEANEEDDGDDDDDFDLAVGDITYDAHVTKLGKFGNRVLRVSESGR